MWLTRPVVIPMLIGLLECLPSIGTADDLPVTGPNLTAGPSAGTDYAGGAYIAFIGGYFGADSKRGTTGNGLTLSALYGQRVYDRLYGEVNILGTIIDTGIDNGTDYYQSGLTLDASYDLNGKRGKSFSPFIIGGIGTVYDAVYPNRKEHLSYLADAGAGFIEPINRLGLNIRFESRFLRDGFEGGRDDYRVTLGLEFPIGPRSSPAAAPVACPATSAPAVCVPVASVPLPAPAPATMLPSQPASLCDTLAPGDSLKIGNDSHGNAVVIKGIEFDSDSATITPGDQYVLGGVATELARCPAVKVEVGGHTDHTASPHYNLHLSQRRADAVRNYLVEKGVDPARLTAKGYGESQPLVDPERSAADKQRNRRVELRVAGSS